jgi:hypothetical protein
MSFNEASLTAAVLCPKFTAAASVMGSSLIVRDVFLRGKNKSDDSSTRHRLLAGMSVCDILSSSAWFLTSWTFVLEKALFSALSYNYCTTGSGTSREGIPRDDRR